VPTRMATLTSVLALVQLIGFEAAAAAKACLLKRVSKRGP
jgi:hypothetical protein